MRFDIQRLLGGLAPTVFSSILPALGRDYSAGSAGVIGLALAVAGQEIDRAAEVLVTANRELRAIFSQASEWVPAGPLATRLREEARSTEPSLRLSVLGAANDRLNTVLIDLHAYAEEASGSAARRTERAILEHLAAAARRELVELPPM